MASSKQVRPFATQGQTTGIHNVVFDDILPKLSGNAVKVLLLILRQTDGWRRDEVGLSFRDISIHTGIASRATVKSALDEVLALGLIVKLREGKQLGRVFDKTQFGINYDAELPWTPKNLRTRVSGSDPLPKIDTPPLPKIDTPPLPKIEPINRKHEPKEKKPHDSDNPGFSELGLNEPGDFFGDSSETPTEAGAGQSDSGFDSAPY